MPTGFDVESGAELSNKLLGLVDWLDAKLKSTTIHQPMTADHLCREAAHDKRIRIEGSDIRAMVNHLRRKEKPIGSQADGYFYAIERQHLDGTIVHMRERIRGIASALRGLEAAQLSITKGQQELL